MSVDVPGMVATFRLVYAPPLSIIEKLSVKAVFTYSLYSSEAKTDAIDMRITPGFGMNENVKVATSNSLAAAFEMPVPGVFKLPAGSGEPGMSEVLPVPKTMPPAIPKFELVDVNVPATVALPPTVKTGVPVSVIPLFPAEIEVAKVAALLVVVIATVAKAGVEKHKSRDTTNHEISSPALKTLFFSQINTCTFKLTSSHKRGCIFDVIECTAKSLWLKKSQFAQSKSLNYYNALQGFQREMQTDRLKTH